MFKSIYIFVFCFTVSILGQTSLLHKLKIVDPNPYFIKLVQETFYEFEKKGWCNLKLDDFKQTLNEITHTNILVTGEVSYSNGFVVSIEKIDLDGFSTSIGSPVVNGLPVTTATVGGTINFRNLKVGYDVITKITGDEMQRRYTGVFTHSLVKGKFHVSKNMNTNVTSIQVSDISTAGGSGVRMVYMPTDEISEILSLRFVASSTFDNAERWMRSDIGSIMLELANTKIPFPDLCFNC